MRKDPLLACILNLLLPGAGHMYIGQIGKGLLILAVGVALGLIVWPATILVIAWSMYDAHKIAKKMNPAARKTLAVAAKQKGE